MNENLVKWTLALLFQGSIFQVMYWGVYVYLVVRAHVVYTETVYILGS